MPSPGEPGLFAGERLGRGDTGLCRKLPCWILLGLGIPGTWGSGACVWVIWLTGVSSTTMVSAPKNPGSFTKVFAFTFMRTGLKKNNIKYLWVTKFVIASTNYFFLQRLTVDFFQRLWISKILKFLNKTYLNDSGYCNDDDAFANVEVHSEIVRFLICRLLCRNVASSRGDNFWSNSPSIRPL